MSCLKDRSLAVAVGRGEVYVSREPGPLCLELDAHSDHRSHDDWQTRWMRMRLKQGGKIGWSDKADRRATSDYLFF
jgi:hypothetical protein